MKTTTLGKTAYEQTYGPVGRGGARSEETLALWEKLKKLPVVEYLLLEMEKGEKLNARRAAIYQAMKKMVEATHSNFKVRLAINKREDHIVLWKEPKV